MTTTDTDHEPSQLPTGWRRLPSAQLEGLLSEFSEPYLTEADYDEVVEELDKRDHESRFDPSAEKVQFGKSRVYQCEPGTEVFLETGTYPSNTFVGASQAYGRVFRRHRMGADDRIVENPGGRWVATADGRVFKARFRPESKHLFERGGTPDPAPAVGYRCEPAPFAEMGVRQEPARFTPEVVYGTMVRFGAMDCVENSGDGL